jgi:hypothetical protein
MGRSGVFVDGATIPWYLAEPEPFVAFSEI